MGEKTLQQTLDRITDYGNNPFDVIFFEACEEGAVEIAYGLRNDCDVLVASEESMLAVGPPWDTIISQLWTWCADPKGSGVDAKTCGDMMAKQYVTSLANGTQTDLSKPDPGKPVVGPAVCEAVDESQMVNVAVALHAFGKALYDGFTSDPNGVLPLYYHTWWEASQLSFSGESLRDRPRMLRGTGRQAGPFGYDTDDRERPHRGPDECRC